MNLGFVHHHLLLHSAFTAEAPPPCSDWSKPKRMYRIYRIYIGIELTIILYGKNRKSLRHLLYTAVYCAFQTDHNFCFVFRTENPLKKFGLMPFLKLIEILLFSVSLDDVVSFIYRVWCSYNTTRLRV